MVPGAHEAIPVTPSFLQHVEDGGPKAPPAQAMGLSSGVTRILPLVPIVMGIVETRPKIEQDMKNLIVPIGKFLTA